MFSIAGWPPGIRLDSPEVAGELSMSAWLVVKPVPCRVETGIGPPPGSRSLHEPGSTMASSGPFPPKTATYPASAPVSSLQRLKTSAADASKVPCSRTARVLSRSAVTSSRRLLVSMTMLRSVSSERCRSEASRPRPTSAKGVPSSSRTRAPDSS